jgi:hypothetical protein
MSNDQISDDGERVALGLEPISDDTPTPAAMARAIAEALWNQDLGLAEALRNQCEQGRSSVLQVRHGALFFQFAFNLLLEDFEAGVSRHESLAAHDWQAIWLEAKETDQ